MWARSYATLSASNASGLMSPRALWQSRQVRGRGDLPSQFARAVCDQLSLRGGGRRRCRGCSRNDPPDRPMAHAFSRLGVVRPAKSSRREVSRLAHEPVSDVHAPHCLYSSEAIQAGGFTPPSLRTETDGKPGGHGSRVRRVRPWPTSPTAGTKRWGETRLQRDFPIAHKSTPFDRITGQRNNGGRTRSVSAGIL